MATFKSGSTTVILKVKSKFTQTFDKMIAMANLFQGSQVNPADYVNNVGEVVAVPRSVRKRMDYKGYSAEGIQVGDTAIFSYEVIYNIEELPDGAFKYKNQLNYKKDEVFLADITDIFAVIRDNQIIMINGYVMIQDISEPSKLILVTQKRVTPNAVSATVIAVGKSLEHQKPIDIQPTERVLLDFRKVQHYQINDQKFGIVQQRHIYAVENSC
jgi:co-chaperonin GroES (HSP10)